MRRAPYGAMLLALGSLALMGAQDRGCITTPEPDTLVAGDAVSVHGTLKEYQSSSDGVPVAGQVRLTVNGTDLPWVTSKTGNWVYPRVTLNIGVNRLSGITSREKDGRTVTGTIDEVIIERRALVHRNKQRVFLDWPEDDPFGSAYDDINKDLKAIARHTLKGPLSRSDLNSFVSGVKDEINRFFDRSYQGTNVVRVNKRQYEANRDTTVHMSILWFSSSRSLYGVMYDSDFGNKNRGGSGSIYIPTFKQVIVDDNRLLEETGAKKTDSLQTRIKDIGTYIGRTVVHEVGHALGLTDEAKLHGCEGSHNCEAYDEGNPTDRFDEGHYIMDAGPKSLIHARMGQANDYSRRAQVPVFNKYNQSYLNIVQHASLTRPRGSRALAAVHRSPGVVCMDAPHGGDAIGAQLRHADAAVIARLRKASATSYDFTRVRALKGKVPRRFRVAADAFTRRKRVAAGRTYLLFLRSGGKGKPYATAVGYLSMVDTTPQEMSALVAVVKDFVRYDKNSKALKQALIRHLGSRSRFAQYSASAGLRRRRLLTARDVGSLAGLMSQGKVTAPRAKLRVIRLIAKHHSTRHKGLLNRLARSSAEKPRVRWAALRALHRLGDNTAVKGAITLVEKSRSLWLKRRLRRLLSR